MENLLKNPVLNVTHKELKSLYEQYGIDDKKKINDDILVIRDWLKKENHLVEAAEYLSDNIIERMYLTAKGSVEATKIRIDKYFTSRGLAPEICLKKNIDEFDLLCSKIQYIVLPKLNSKDNTRIQIMRFLSSDLEDISHLSILRYITMLLDYMQSVDYHFGVRTIVDYNNFPFSFLFKVNPMLVKKMENLSSKGYGLKIKGIHMVNVPNFIDKVLTLIKQSLSEKLTSRIFVHSTYEDLHEYISKETLPKEYNGDGPSCTEISEQWKQTLQSEDGRRTIANTEKLIADETKRSSYKFNEEYLGMPGSFKVLSVD